MAGKGLTNTASSPYAKLRSVDIGAVKWREGFWFEKLHRCHQAMIPNMWRLLEDPDISHAYKNFLIAARIEKGEHRGPGWHDGDFYKWLEATASVYALSKDKALDILMDEVIAVIGKAQQANGYLHTPVIIKWLNGETNAEPFKDPGDFEMYNFGHLMSAACLHYRSTGKTSLLDIARKASDYLYHNFASPTAELARNAICPSHYMGIVEMYRTTGERRFLDLAKAFINIRDLVQDGTDQNQDRLPFRKQTRAIGHAVRANYLYAGAADLYAETGERSLLAALEQIWENVVLTKMYITGATGALYDGASPDGSKKHEEIQLVHQAYGREYQLPNITAYNESCATVGSVLWNWRMLAVTGEARFADILELTLYNGVLATISLDGKEFFYVNTLRKVDDLPFELRWSRKREPYISCFCCPPNTVRTIAQVGSYAYSLSDEGVWVNLYGSSVLETELPDGTRISLLQSTEYPWDGEVRFTMELSEDKAFAVMLRIPEWAADCEYRVNGKTHQKDLIPGRYTRIKRVWSNGDVIELSLPMPIQLIEAHPLVEEVRNHVAVKRGPIVYCLESDDLPKDVKVSEVAIPRDICLRPRVDTEIFNGKIVVLEGKAQAFREDDWSKRLYRELPREQGAEIEVRLVPYYAWGNRSHSEMTVWMPLR